MSRVHVKHTLAKDTFPVNAAAIATGWLPGQFFALDALGESAEIGSADNILFIGIDDEDELSSPPSGSLVTGVYGSGTKLVIDHSEEVAAANAARAYETAVESGSVMNDMYASANGKWTTGATGSVKGKMYQIPTADNNYSLGVILRF